MGFTKKDFYNKFNKEWWEKLKQDEDEYKLYKNFYDEVLHYYSHDLENNNFRNIFYQMAIADKVFSADIDSMDACETLARILSAAGVDFIDGTDIIMPQRIAWPQSRGVEYDPKTKKLYVYSPQQDRPPYSIIVWGRMVKNLTEAVAELGVKATNFCYMKDQNFTILSSDIFVRIEPTNVKTQGLYIRCC